VIGCQHEATKGCTPDEKRPRTPLVTRSFSPRVDLLVEAARSGRSLVDQCPDTPNLRGMMRSVLIAVCCVALLTAGCASIHEAIADMGPPAADRSDYYGTFQGTYHCGQGETGVQLTVSSGDGAAPVDALFEFYPTEQNPRVPTGSFKLVGDVQPNGLLVLEPAEWINRPTAWQMVGLTLRPVGADGVIRGEVTHSACDWIRVRRQ
jgi:hypothetical protein